MGTIVANGTIENNIEMGSMKNKWKGIYVLNADKPSLLNYVKIHNTSALEDGILSLTGGVTFYKSDIIMSDVFISGSSAEDSLNIVNSKFTLRNININNAISDGIDIDFSDGSISKSRFTDIGGDALDFSGSNAEVSKIIFKRVQDKALSIGEASEISINNINIEDVGIGIASKDGSKVSGSFVNIKNYLLSGVMSYMKKTFYYFPMVELSNVKVATLGNAFSRQIGSYMRINDTEIPAKSIDVKRLYNNEIMKK